MVIVPFQAEHLARLDAQDAQQYIAQWMQPGLAQALEGPNSFTALDGDRVLGCGGAVEHWHNRAELWAYLSRNLSGHFVGIHRATLRFIDLLPHARIEATTVCDFKEGHAWLKMLGFELEAPRMRRYLPTGDDAALYVRIR